MAKVRLGTIGRGSYANPDGKSLLRPNLSKPLLEPRKYNLSKLSLEEYKLELKKFNDDLPKTIANIITFNKLYIAQIVKNRLYNLQTNSEEQKISVFPTAMYNAKKERSRNRVEKTPSGKRKVIERVDLFDTGAFYNSLSAEYVNGEIKIISNDYKKETLTKKYGKNVFQLTTKEVEWINKNIIDKEIQNILDSMAFRADFKL